ADGHPVGGALTFSVGAPSGMALQPQTESRAKNVAIWAAKLVLYIGLFAGVGGAWWVSPGSRQFVAAALLAGLAAAALSVGLQGADALGLPLSGMLQAETWAAAFATSYAVSALLAALALVLGLVSLQTNSRWFAAVALAGVGLALAASGHAATAE